MTFVPSIYQSLDSDGKRKLFPNKSETVKAIKATVHEYPIFNPIVGRAQSSSTGEHHVTVLKQVEGVPLSVGPYQPYNELYYKDTSKPQMPSPEPYETNTGILMAQQIYSDGVRKNPGFFQELAVESQQESVVGNALADLTKLLKQGVPMKIPGMSDDDFKALLAEQVKSVGLQQKLFGEQKDKEQATARQEELVNLFQSGNLTQDQILEQLRDANDRGDLTNDQLAALTDLTGKLAGAKTEAERLAIEKEVNRKLFASIESAKKSKMLKDIDDIEKKREKDLSALDKNLFDGTPVEVKGDNISVKKALSIENPEKWIDLFKLRGSSSSGEILFDGDSLTDTLDELQKGNWTSGGNVTQVRENRNRLVLDRILKFIVEEKSNPTYEEVRIMQSVSRGFSNFAKGKVRNDTMDQFKAAVEAEFNRVGTPAKMAASSMISGVITPVKGKAPTGPTTKGKKSAKAKGV